MLVVEFFFVSGNTISYITIQKDSSHLIFQYLETVVKFAIFLNCILKMVSGNLTETSVVQAIVFAFLVTFMALLALV